MYNKSPAKYSKGSPMPQNAAPGVIEDSKARNDVLACIRTREALLERAQRYKGDSSGSTKSLMLRLLQALRNSSIDVVEAIERWSTTVNRFDLSTRNQILSYVTTCDGDANSAMVVFRDKPYVSFCWNGESYILKMLHDMEFLQDIPQVASFLERDCGLQHNPFLLPYTVDELLRKGPIGPCSSRKVKSICCEISGIPIKRIMDAVATVAIEEAFYRINQLDAITEMPSIESTAGCNNTEISGGQNEKIVIAKRREVSATPPARKRIRISKQSPSEHKSAGRSPAKALTPGKRRKLDLLPPQKKDSKSDSAVQLEIPSCQQQQQQQLGGPRNDARTLENVPVAKIEGADLDHSTDVRQPLPSQSINKAEIIINTDPCDTVDRPLEAATVAFVAVHEKDLKETRKSVSLSMKSECAPAGELSALESKELTAANTSVSLSAATGHDAELEEPMKVNLSLSVPLASVDQKPQDSDISFVEVDPSSTVDLPAQNLGQSVVGNEMVPFPLPFLIDVTLGSRVISCPLESLSTDLLQAGDKIKIGSVDNSPDWIISSVVPQDVPRGSMLLTSEYRIFNQDPLHLDCLIYSPCTDPPLVATSPSLDTKGLRAWKLIPKCQDSREPWKLQYDNGDVPWNTDFNESSGFANHFHARIPWATVEDMCKDHPYDPRLSPHQQRVEYFNKVPASFIIEKAFQEICGWPPVTNSIDSFKWSNFARKMKFLFAVKNASHEVDMAFFRHTGRRQTRKLDVQAFSALLADLAVIQYPSLREQPEKATDVLLSSTVVMLPFVNKMVWKEAKLMAVKTEARRLCAQIRLASLCRKVFCRARYKRIRCAEIRLASAIRRRAAELQKSELIALAKQGRQCRQRYTCSSKCQTVWRRYYRANEYLVRKNLLIKADLESERRHRGKMREHRKLLNESIVFRQVRLIQLSDVLVTIRLTEIDLSKGEHGLDVQVYVRSTRQSFRFLLDERTWRNCLNHNPSQENGGIDLSAREWPRHLNLTSLTQKLIVRKVSTRLTVFFRRHNINEQGTLMAMRCVKLRGTPFVLSIFRSSMCFNFVAYNPSSCSYMRTQVSTEGLVLWILDEHGITVRKDSAQLADSKQKHQQHLLLLDQDRQSDLASWLIARIALEPDDAGLLTLTLGCFSYEKKKHAAASVVQGLCRMLRSRLGARTMLKGTYEKIYNQERACYYYMNTATGEMRWSKPTLLGPDDIPEPKNEWRKVAPTAELVEPCYFNPATGQTSWLSAEDAALMVQKKFREQYTLELFGSRISLHQVAGTVNMVADARRNFERDPTRLTYRVNYALLCHCIEFDFSKARELYKKVIEQSPSHPIIARAYGLFLLATCEAPRQQMFSKALQLLREAQVGDPDLKMFQKAKDSFFHWAVIIHPKNPIALLNYALLQQCVIGNYNLAEKLYRRALSVDPSNAWCLQNFEDFEKHRYPGGAFETKGPSFSVIRRSRVFEEKPEWGEWQHLHDAFSPVPAFSHCWYNRLTKVALFNEPDWNAVWRERKDRSSEMANAGSGWIVYWDERLKQKFLHNSLTGAFACDRS